MNEVRHGTFCEDLLLGELLKFLVGLMYSEMSSAKKNELKPKTTIAIEATVEGVGVGCTGSTGPDTTPAADGPVFGAAIVWGGAGNEGTRNSDGCG